MMIIVVYDIDVNSPGGVKRLQRLAKECLNWGHRIQNSVYECEVNAEQYRRMVDSFLSCVDVEKDGLCLYNLGNNFKNKIIHLTGKKFCPHLDPFVL